MEEKTSWVVYQIPYVVEIAKIEIQSVLLIEKLWSYPLLLKYSRSWYPLQSFYEASEGKEKVKRLIRCYFGRNCSLIFLSRIQRLSGSRITRSEDLLHPPINFRDGPGPIRSRVDE